MPIDLESLTPALFNKCDTLLGDTITITPPSAGPITIKVNASYKDDRLDFGASSSTAQDILIDIDMALVPSKPGAGWRVTLPLIPGKIFEPRNVNRDTSGLRWELGLKEIKNG